MPGVVSQYKFDDSQEISSIGRRNSLMREEREQKSGFSSDLNLKLINKKNRSRLMSSLFASPGHECFPLLLRTQGCREGREAAYRRGSCVCRRSKKQTSEGRNDFVGYRTKLPTGQKAKPGY